MSEPSVTAHDPYAALKIRNYRDYLAGSFFALLGRQAVTAVAIWQVYQWTHSSTALGLVGLVNVLPLLVLSLPAGAIADRHDRRKLIGWGTTVTAFVNIALGSVAFWHAAVPDFALLRWANAALQSVALVFEHHAVADAMHFDQPALPLVFLLLLAHASARILIWPARSSITPLLVPTSALSNAITWNTSTFEIATVAGPAIGGFLIAYVGIPPVYALGALFEFIFLLA